MSAWLIVNEVKIGAVGSGCEWWFWYRQMAEKSQRPPVVLETTMVGDVVALERDDAEDCHWMHTYMAEQGIPKHAVHVTTRNPAGQS